MYNIRIIYANVRYMDDNGGAGAGVEEDDDIDDDNYDNYEESNDTDPYEYEEINETEISTKKIATKSKSEKDIDKDENKEISNIEKNIENKMKIDIKCEQNNKNNENNFIRKIKKPLTVGQRHKKMSEALCDVLSDFGLVSFLPMNVQDGEVRTILFLIVFSLFIFI